MKHNSNEHQTSPKLGTHHERAKRYASTRQRDIEEQEWKHIKADTRAGRPVGLDEEDDTVTDIGENVDDGQYDRDCGPRTRFGSNNFACIEDARWASLT